MMIINRSAGANKSNQEVNVYPNPFSGNEFTISRSSETQQTYELFTSEAILLSSGLLQLSEHIITVKTDYKGLLILKTADADWKY